MGVAECGQWMDSGNWHIRFGNHFLKLFFSSAIILISMANVEGGVAEDLSDYIPNVCTSSPEYGLAFCKEHSKLIADLGYPVELRAFLKSCANKDVIDTENFTKDMQKRVDETLIEISKKIPASNNFKSCADAQG